MLSFKQYLQEAVAEMKRESMIKFIDMSDSDFQIFLDELKKNKNIITSDTKLFAKLDGFPVKVGLDSDSNFFLETSKSGPKYSANFLKFTEDKIAEQEKVKGKPNARKEEMLNRGSAYDEVFNTLKGLAVFKKIYDLYGNNFKIYAEVMSNKLGKESEDKQKLKFVSVYYDKDKLGKLLTIFPYRVLKADDNSLHPKSNEIIQLLLKSSNSNIKFLPAKLEIKESGIDLSSVIKSTNDKNELKKKIAETILKAEDKIPDIYQIGKEIEGVVIWVNGKEYKITTEKFQESKKAEKKK